MKCAVHAYEYQMNYKYQIHAVPQGSGRGIFHLEIFNLCPLLVSQKCKIGTFWRLDCIFPHMKSCGGIY